jgi:hypothetical protein
MGTEAELLDHIYRLTRGDLEAATFPRPEPSILLRDTSLVRLARMSRFWQVEAPDSPRGLPQAVADLLLGLHGAETPWSFAIEGDGADVRCWFGVPSGAVGEARLAGMLSASFPGADVRVEPSRLARPGDFARALMLSGRPTAKRRPDSEQPADQVERICRGLRGHRWTYLVQATPRPAVDCIQMLNETVLEIRRVRSTMMLKSSAVDESDPLAQRYVRLLEQKLKRLEEGRVCGLWDARTLLFVEDAALAGRAKALLLGSFAGEESQPDPVRVAIASVGARGWPTLEPVTSLEAATLARPPHESYPEYEVVEFTTFGLQAEAWLRADALRVRVGDVLDHGAPTGQTLQLERDTLTRHALVVGLTGSGKTNTCLSLIEQAWDGGAGVPFLIIEPAKSEYRKLLRQRGFRGLRVFTVADERTAPLRLNPFEVPDGILVQTHIDYLKSLFSAAFVLYPPMPYVLEQSLQEVYEDHGWDLARNTNARFEGEHPDPPTLDELARKVGEVISRMGYDERITMDVRAGLLARINQLRLGGGKGRMLGSRRSVSPEVLFERPCLLELKQVVSDDEKAFIIGLVLIRLVEHVEVCNAQRGGRLHHLTLIEEAHRLLRNVSTEQGSEVVANPRGRSIEVFANVLSEIRAYGEGVVIAEQIPSKLTPDAIKNTGLKIVHRLGAEDDRRAVGATMNLSEAQMRALATLRVGEAVVHAEGMSVAARVLVPLAVAAAACRRRTVYSSNCSSRRWSREHEEQVGR